MLTDRLQKVDAAIAAVEALVQEAPPAVRRPAKADVLALLQKQGSLRPCEIELALGISTTTFRAWLDELLLAGAVTTTGRTNATRVHLGPTPPEQPIKVRRARSVRPTPASSPVAAPSPSSNGNNDPQEEATRQARRYGHRLGPFKPSGVGAAAAFIARCTACDTYVTIGRDRKIAGPGVRHECLASTRTLSD